MENRERETLGSRAGFLLLAAGCSIGLGNIWRFPFITGQYGGTIEIETEPGEGTCFTLTFTKGAID